MTVRCVQAADVPPQPWRNGGGQTRELLCWPQAGDWSLRISLADITADGPFSAFPGLTRWFGVIEGAGVRLGFPEGDRDVRAGDAPLRFDGAAAPACALLGGPTRDLNLMARGGTSTMQAVLPRDAWQAPFSWRALFTAAPGRWTGGGASLGLAAHTLLWDDEAGTTAWHFHPDGAPRVAGWWLAFTPSEGRP
jgi:environmental stress-induced protein Ves